MKRLHGDRRIYDELPQPQPPIVIAARLTAPEHFKIGRNAIHHGSKIKLEIPNMPALLHYPPVNFRRSVTFTIDHKDLGIFVQRQFVFEF